MFEVWHVERKAWHKRGMQRTAGVIRILLVVGIPILLLQNLG
jgi:hypothetical protein